MLYAFNVTWEVTVSVDAETEEEAWEQVQDAVDTAWGKSYGDKHIELLEDAETEDDWGLFDTDPEETNEEWEEYPRQLL